MTYAEDTNCHTAIFPPLHKSWQPRGGGGRATAEKVMEEEAQPRGVSGWFTRHLIYKPEISPRALSGTRQQTHTWTMNWKPTLWAQRVWFVFLFYWEYILKIDCTFKNVIVNIPQELLWIFFLLHPENLFLLQRDTFYTFAAGILTLTKYAMSLKEMKIYY